MWMVVSPEVQMTSVPGKSQKGKSRIATGQKPCIDPEVKAEGCLRRQSARGHRELEEAREGPLPKAFRRSVGTSSALQWLSLPRHAGDA